MGMMLQKLKVVFCLIAISLTANAASTETFYENASGSPLFKLLDSAKTSIDIEIYEIQDTRVHDAVYRALKRGVKVRIVQESEALMSGCKIFDQIYARDPSECKVQKNFVQKVQSLGGFYVPYEYQYFCSEGKHGGCLQHGKMVLIDGKKAMLSTGNFNPTNLCDPDGLVEGVLTRCNRDFSVVSTDPNVVAALYTVFNSDFARKAYDLPKILKNKAALKVTVSPYSLNPILQYIASAKKSILIENQYLKNPEMNEALMVAAKKGIKVFIVVNSACAFGRLDPKSTDINQINFWKDLYKAFDQAGVKSRMFTKSISIKGYQGYLHSKAIVVDGVSAWVGSVNGSTQALTQNREFGIFMNDQTEVKKLVDIIISDFNHPNSESWQEGIVCKKD